MDVERTMEFILQQQSKAEGQTAALRKLVLQGMKMVIRNGEQIKELRTEMSEQRKEISEQRKEMVELRREVVSELKELAKAQRVTETKLQAFIDSLRRGGNGRHIKN